MAKDPGVRAPTERRPVRTPARGASASQKVVAGSAAAPVAARGPKKPFNPQKFAQEVRVEARKITWPSWKETWITSTMVGVMVIFTALFFFLVDNGLLFAVSQFLKLAG